MSAYSYQLGDFLLDNSDPNLDDRVVNPVIEILEQPAQQIRFLNSCQLGDLSKDSNDKIGLLCALRNLNFDLSVLRLYVMVSLVEKNEPHGPHIHNLKCTDNTIVARSELFKTFNSQIPPNSFFFELDSATKECQIKDLFVVNSSMEELREICAREVLKRRMQDTGTTYSALLDTLPENDHMINLEIRNKLRNAASSNEALLRLQVIIYNSISNTLDSFLTEPAHTNPITNLAFNKSEFFRDPHKQASKLKIVRSSRIGGRMQGNDELFMFCSNVDPNDIQIEFFQITEDAQISWRALGRLDRSDIHSNCALVVYTPEYPIKSLTPAADDKSATAAEKAAPVEKVKVYYRLLKPSTGEYSEKWVFYYFLKANDDFVNLFSTYFSEEKFIRRYRHFLANSAFEKSKTRTASGARSESAKRAKRKKLSKDADSESKKSTDTEMREENLSDTTDESEDESDEADDQIDEKNELDSEMWTDQVDEAAASAGAAAAAATAKPKKKNKLKSLDAVSAADINSNSNSPDSSLAKTTANKLNISSIPAIPQSGVPSATTNQRETIDRSRFSLESLEGLDAKALKENLASCITKMNGLAERSGKALIKFAKTRSLHELLKTQRFLLNHQDENGNTPIHLSIIYGNLDILEIFVDIATTIPYQNLINMKNSKQITPLLLAAHLSEPQICEFLLEAKAEITAVDSNGCNIIHVACKNKNLELLKVAIKYVEKTGHYETIDAINHDGYSPLHIAVMNKSQELTRELLYVKPLKINMADRRTGMTALHHAAAYSDLLTICSLLVNNESIEIDAKAFNGCTPLHVAVANKNYLIVALLVKHNANIYLQSDMPVHNDSELYHSAQRKYNTLRKVIEGHVQPSESKIMAVDKADAVTEKSSSQNYMADMPFPDAKLSEEIYRDYEQEMERDKQDDYSDARVRAIPSQHNFDATFYAQSDPWMLEIFKNPKKLDKVLLKKIICYEKVKRSFADKFGLSQSNTTQIIKAQIKNASQMISDMENNKTSNPVKMSLEERPT